MQGSGYADHLDMRENFQMAFPPSTDMGENVMVHKTKEGFAIDFHC